MDTSHRLRCEASYYKYLDKTGHADFILNAIKLGIPAKSLDDIDRSTTVDLVLNRLILKQSALDEWCDGLNLPVKTVAGHIVLIHSATAAMGSPVFQPAVLERNGEVKQCIQLDCPMVSVGRIRFCIPDSTGDSWRNESAMDEDLDVAKDICVRTYITYLLEKEIMTLFNANEIKIVDDGVQDFLSGWVPLPSVDDWPSGQAVGVNQHMELTQLEQIGRNVLEHPKEKVGDHM
ncbi:hypothetical protein DAPPUDRAFT_246705 [Daphnia pulex]|uniref:Uncharacterized protein n=1 Tax=Daphnia pulex TaxID=6669 RepID=E9GR29_DAPPU|nr:hypothetical protein DAPPUDRAFT_246705 [Daphnia pulex]|eukprot:EFX78065.1 hypothetical protein DAPPUDRAFT_246705 [Daphnia pulex]